MASAFQGAVPVTIFRTASTRGKWTSEAEFAAFLRAYTAFLEKYRPDAVWTYGGDAAGNAMIRLAKDRDIVVVFGLHNFGYQDRGCFAAVDYVTVPSEFSRQYHWAALGLACQTLPYAIDWQRVQVSGREPRFVTFVNPQTSKGLYLFARIAEALARRRPDIMLMVIEGRSQATWRQETGIDLRRLPNVSAMSSMGDPRSFYVLTKILLMPSLWNESFGLAPAEAMINGIPVLASNRGALPETMGDAGFLFDIPAWYTPHTRTLPTPRRPSRGWRRSSACGTTRRSTGRRARRPGSMPNIGGRSGSRRCTASSSAVCSRSRGRRWCQGRRVRPRCS